MVEHVPAEMIDDGSTSDGMPLMAKIDHTDPGNPLIYFECGCNELWLDQQQAKAALHYLQRVLPLKGGENG